MSIPYRICGRCIMDTSDPEISFDANGVCNHCSTYDERVRLLIPDTDDGQALQALASRISDQGKGREYDCIIGLSGGADSSYVAYLAVRLGLRPLAVHLDNGWDSELAVTNIEHLTRLLKIDLYTHVIDWDEFRELQLAFLKASTPDSEIPTDHAIISLLFQTAKRFGVKYILSGVNIRTESHLPRVWSQGHYDWSYIRRVNKRLGTLPLTTYPHMTLPEVLTYRRSVNWVDILNYARYVKSEAVQVLSGKLGWRPYAAKHHESVYTRFYQCYILPRKFGYDKRRSHLSSLICSGAMSREDALKKLANEPIYDGGLESIDYEYVVKKLGISEEEFQQIMAAPPSRYEEWTAYPEVLREMPYRIARTYHRLKTRQFMKSLTRAVPSSAAKTVHGSEHAK